MNPEDSPGLWRLQEVVRALEQIAETRAVDARDKAAHAEEDDDRFRARWAAERWQDNARRLAEVASKTNESIEDLRREKMATIATWIMAILMLWGPFLLQAYFGGMESDNPLPLLSYELFVLSVGLSLRWQFARPGGWRKIFAKVVLTIVAGPFLLLLLLYLLSPVWGPAALLLLWLYEKLH